MLLEQKEAKQEVKRRKTLAKSMQDDFLETHKLLEEMGLKEFNKTARYKWKKVFNGYSSSLRIFSEKKNFYILKKRIIFYDIECLPEFEEKIESQDTEIFEALREANTWISSKLEVFKQATNKFSIEAKECKKIIKDEVDIFSFLELKERSF